MSGTEDISLSLFEQGIQTLIEVPNVILAGRGNDDVGLSNIKSAYVVVDIVWEGCVQLEGFEELRHAPSWVFEEEAQLNVRLGAEGVDVSGIDLVVPTHGFYNRDLERLLLGRCPFVSNWRVLRGRRGGCCRVGRRDRVMESKILYIERSVRGLAPWTDETLVIYRKENENGNDEEN